VLITAARSRNSSALMHGSGKRERWVDIASDGAGKIEVREEAAAGRCLKR
jgi:hypothetical protein